MRIIRWQNIVVCGAVSFLPVLSSPSARADIIAVQVLGSDGKAASQARVFVSQRAKRGVTKTVSASTDAAGKATFDLEPLAAGSPFYGSVTIVGQNRALEGGALKKDGNVFRLAPSRTLQGRVVDEAGLPVAGARVTLGNISIGDFGDEDSHSITLPAELKTEFSATSDAAGGWTIDGVPEAAFLSVQLDDERYVSNRNYQQSEAGDSKAGDSIVLVARRGAILEGRVVDVAGQPLAGINVVGSEASQRGDNYAQAETDAQGKYRLTGLKATGALSVWAMASSDLELVAPALKNIAVTVENTAQAPDLQMVAGIELQGIVRDAATQKPIAGASINASMTQNKEATGASESQSGADGSYKIRVLPGEVSLTASHPDYNYAGKGSYNDPFKLTVEAGAQPKQEIALTPRVVLAGVAVDETGKALSGARFRIGERWSGSSVTTDEKGAWTTKSGGGETAFLRSVGNWILVSPKQITLPPKAPLRVVLRRATFETVAGRVITPDGQPLAGAKISLSAVEDGPGPNSVRNLPAVTSDAEGRYKIPTLIAGYRPMQVGARLDKHLFVSGPAYNGFKKGAGAWTATDIVLAPLAGSLSGRILNSDGQPVAGAFVVADRGASGMVQTGPDGGFVLDKLIGGDLNVSAFAGDSAATAPTKIGDQPAELTLTLQPTSPPEPRDVAGAFDLLADILTESKSTETWWKRGAVALMVPFDAERAAQLRALAKLPAPGGGAGAPEKQDAGSLWGEIVSAPERAVLRADEYLKKIEPRQQKAFQSLFGSTLGLTLVQTDAPRAEELLETSETILRGMTVGERGGSLSESILACAMTGALAAKLGHPSAQTWADFTLSIIEREYPVRQGMREDIKRRVLTIAARGGDENYERFASEVPAGVRIAALSETIDKTIDTDPKAALALLDKLEALPAAKQNDDFDQRTDKQYAFGRVALKLVKSLAKTDPAAALTLARRIGRADQRALALAFAAQGQSGTAREALFREAIELSTNAGSATGARIVALAFDSDPIFGKTLFDALLVRIEADQQSRPDRGYYDTPEAAFTIARIDRAAARRLIERSFAAQKASAQPGNDWSLNGSALAMSAVDIPRALEMARSIGDENTRISTQTRIAAYALSSEAERRTLTLQDLRSGQWQPGKGGTATENDE